MTTTCESASSAKNSEIRKKYKYELLEDVHLALTPPSDGSDESFYTRGNFKYFHYNCDTHSDAGWGCGYRTLQTVISWIVNKRKNDELMVNVPSIPEIQRILVEIGDKPARFVGSRDWIGTMEEFYVMDKLFQVPCKFAHVRSLREEEVLKQIRDYFEEYSGLVTMGGLSDTASKAIAGIHVSPTDGVSLLILDPHFNGVPKSKQELIDRGYVRWMHTSEFENSTYNLCFVLQK